MSETKKIQVNEKIPCVHELEKYCYPTQYIYSGQPFEILKSFYRKKIFKWNQKRPQIAKLTYLPDKNILQNHSYQNHIVLTLIYTDTHTLTHRITIVSRDKPSFYRQLIFSKAVENTQKRNESFSVNIWVTRYPHPVK